jgi:hypothetical protein
LGERKMIMGQRGRATMPPLRASDWMRLISSTAWLSVAAIAWCIVGGSDPPTKSGSQP